uniref:Uncharacterized protein n=1 Tax=Globodera rostochiensis TaxID=31243 RepID=A0A914ID05_GLORO
MMLQKQKRWNALMINIIATALTAGNVSLYSDNLVYGVPSSLEINEMKQALAVSKWGCTGDGEDKASQCHKLLGDLIPDGYCDCFIGERDANMSNDSPSADKFIRLPPLNKKSAGKNESRSNNL